MRFVESLLPAGTGRTKVAFGTEGGLFTRHLDVPVVVCGPGSIVQAHKPDEYVSRAQRPSAMPSWSGWWQPCSDAVLA